MSDSDSRVDVDDADFSITSLLKCSETASLRQKLLILRDAAPHPTRAAAPLTPAGGHAPRPSQVFQSTSVAALQLCHPENDSKVTLCNKHYLVYKHEAEVCCHGCYRRETN